jgi:hypothetical protein
VFQTEEINYFYLYSPASLSLFYISLKTSWPLVHKRPHSSQSVSYQSYCLWSLMMMMIGIFMLIDEEFLGLNENVMTNWGIYYLDGAYHTLVGGIAPLVSLRGRRQWRIYLSRHYYINYDVIYRSNVLCYKKFALW